MAAAPFCAKAQSTNQYQSIDKYEEIDQYINPLVLGLNTQAGVTVQSRLHPEYDTPGLQYGLVTLLPSLDEGFGYDDNVTATSNARGSVRVDTIAKVNAKANTSDSTVSLGLEVDDHEFPDLSNQSYTNGSGSLIGTHKFGEDQLYLGVTYYDQKQTPRNLGLPHLDHPIDSQMEDLFADYIIDLRHLQIQSGMDVRFFSFKNGTVDGIPYLQSYRDRNVYEPSLSADYEFAQGRKLVMVIRDSSAIYYGAYPGLAKQDFNNFSVLTGISYDVDGVVNLRLLAGYEQRLFSSRSFRAIRAPIVEGSVTWTPSELTTVTALVGRYIEDSAADGTVGYTETTAAFALDHELFRNVILSLNAGLKSDQYAQGRATQSLYEIGAGGTWVLNRSFRLQVYYTHYTRRGQSEFGPTEAPTDLLGNSENYAENIFLVRLRFAL